MKQEKSSCLKTLDNVEKIDLSNDAQFRSLCDFYHKNTNTIDFWLNSCVFPKEMQQYPQRLVGNPWHLAHNGKGNIVGFSGTNDNHRILPLQMCQYFPPNSEDHLWNELGGCHY